MFVKMTHFGHSSTQASACSALVDQRRPLAPSV